MMSVSRLPEPALYQGRVMHQRLRPFRHRFVYRVFSLLLDLDRLEESGRRLRLLAIERPGVMSFCAADHGARDGSPLRPWVERELAAHGLGHAAERIFLLCFPRVLGYVFNPLSVYWCYGPDEGLGAIIYEVKNTFGEQRAYVLPVAAGRPADAPIRQGCAKDLYVSPFIAMAAGYRFKLSPPGERVSIAIQEEVEAGAQLVATLTAERRPLTDRALALAMLGQPLMTYKVIAGIHWEAMKLWWKGAKLQPRDPQSGAYASSSAHGIGISGETTKLERH
jgi:uncharacterized protein